MHEPRNDEVWILGAAGRVGGRLAGLLVDRGVTGVVLVGRPSARLVDLHDDLGVAVRTIEVDGLDAIVNAVRTQRPHVVVNLLGAFGDTGPAIATACMPGGRYVDLASDLTAIAAIHALDVEAVDSGSTLITGAGFGVLATEAPLVGLCQNRPAPARVRVAALGSFASQKGVMGEAFARTSVDVLVTGGRRYRGGRLEPTRLGSDVRQHELPDGTNVTSAAVPSGELFAAHTVSGAPDVDFTSALAPTAPFVRAALPLLSWLLRYPAMRRLMIRQMSASKTKEAPRPRPHSWGHAVAEWADGTRREAWLRAEDSMDFTAASVAAVVTALRRDDVKTGAYTPAAAFGPQIAVDAGATLIVDGR